MAVIFQFEAGMYCHRNNLIGMKCCGIFRKYGRDKFVIYISLDQPSSSSSSSSVSSLIDNHVCSDFTYSLHLFQALPWYGLPFDICCLIYFRIDSSRILSK
jgi:hypothetical protein